MNDSGHLPMNAHIRKITPIFEGGQLKLGEEHFPSLEVRAALVAWTIQKGLKYGHLMDALRWDGMNGCFCFHWAGMYVGVETDGHIHT